MLKTPTYRWTTSTSRTMHSVCSSKVHQGRLVTVHSMSCATLLTRTLTSQPETLLTHSTSTTTSSPPVKVQESQRTTGRLFLQQATQFQVLRMDPDSEFVIQRLRRIEIQLDPLPATTGFGYLVSPRLKFKTTRFKTLLKNRFR